MTTTANMKPAMQPSPLQALATAAATGQPDSPHSPDLRTLAIQILHNLQYQHSWTKLQIHTHSPLTGNPLPRPLISGLPPQRLYVHPDEQIELLKDADRKRKAAKDAKEGLDVEAEPEPEWVLPTRLSEKWTLHRLADVFNGISVVPPAAETAATQPDRPTNPWRTTKRVVLASADSDSTVVYYILHDGVVKPRQN